MIRFKARGGAVMVIIVLALLGLGGCGPGAKLAHATDLLYPRQILKHSTISARHGDAVAFAGFDAFQSKNRAQGGVENSVRDVTHAHALISRSPSPEARLQIIRQDSFTGRFQGLRHSSSTTNTSRFLRVGSVAAVFRDGRWTCHRSVTHPVALRPRVYFDTPFLEYPVPGLLIAAAKIHVRVVGAAYRIMLFLSPQAYRKIFHQDDTAMETIWINRRTRAVHSISYRASGKGASAQSTGTSTGYESFRTIHAWGRVVLPEACSTRVVHKAKKHHRSGVALLELAAKKLRQPGYLRQTGVSRVSLSSAVGATKWKHLGTSTTQASYRIGHWVAFRLSQANNGATSQRNQMILVRSRTAHRQGRSRWSCGKGERFTTSEAIVQMGLRVLALKPKDFGDATIARAQTIGGKRFRIVGETFGRRAYRRVFGRSGFAKYSFWIGPTQRVTRMQATEVDLGPKPWVRIQESVRLTRGGVTGIHLPTACAR